MELNHRSGQKITIIIGVSLLAVALLAYFGYSSAQHGAPTKEKVVDAYLHALATQNVPAVIHLTPKSRSADEEAKAKVAQLNAKALRDVKVEYISDFVPELAIANIFAKYTDPQGRTAQFSDQLHLEEVNNRWFLMLGKVNEGLPSELPSSSTQVSRP